MQKHKTMPDGDIATQKYRGPSVALTSAGYLYASHLLAVLGGVVAASIAAYFAHGHVSRFVIKTREWGARSGGRIESWTQSLFGRTPGTHELFGVSGVAGSEKLKELVYKEEKGFFELLAWKFAKWLGKSERAGQFLENQSEEKLSAVFIGGGLGGAAGWIGSTVWSLFEGHKTGNQGKTQFKQAQAEIKHLREQNAGLEARGDSKEQTEDIAEAPAKKDDKRHPHASHGHGAKHHNPDTRLHTDQTEHHGILAAEHSRAH